MQLASQDYLASNQGLTLQQKLQHCLPPPPCLAINHTPATKPRRLATAPHPRCPATARAGVEQLCAKERELCASCRLLPAHYLAMKESLMRDCQQNGFLSRQEARSFFRWAETG